MADTRPQQPTRREQAREEARTRILAASAECIVRDGLAMVRMAGIAQAANVSAGLLHYHFDTKQRLFAELLAYSHGVSSVLDEQAMERAGTCPAQRLMSFLDRCLPSDERLADEWLLWRELALLCIRRPELAAVGAEVCEDRYSTVARIIAEGVDAGDFQPAIDARVVAETAVALCDGLGGRVLANDPQMDLGGARAALAATVGVLVGHEGPLPEPVEAPASAAT
jgi:AcrR family transcriptional regulator